MAAKQLPFVLLAVLNVCSAKQLKANHSWGSNVCKDTEWGTFCPRIISKGLGRSGAKYSSTYSTCMAHSINTKSSSGQPQGSYMQKCMQEYCTRGECSNGGKDSFLLSLHRGSKKWGSKKKKGGDKKKKGGDKKKKGYGWTGPYMRGPKGNKWPKQPCEDADYYCGELCHNLYHPVLSDLGEHPGTQNCSPSKCPNDDECKKDCLANWESMKVIYDDFCACEKERGSGKYPNGLLEEEEETSAEEEETESVDVGAFIQTSMSSDQKAEEL